MSSHFARVRRDKNKPASSADNAKAETTQTAASDNVQQDGSNPCASAKRTIKNKHKAKPTPTDQDREFDKVLQEFTGNQRRLHHTQIVAKCGIAWG